MDDQDYGRFGAPIPLHQEDTDTIETLELVGSVIPMTRTDDATTQSADDGLLGDIDEIARVAALAGLDSAIATLNGTPNQDPFADECLGDIALVVATMVEDLEACASIVASPEAQSSPTEPTKVDIPEKVLEPAL